MGMPVHPSARDSADTQAVAARQREVATRLLRWIMGGIVIWGAVHALGAWTLNHDVRRPLIVLICVAAFLGFWLAMLANRRQRMKKKHGPLG
jgi:CHASE2 domain-containing sensor protein